MRSHCLLVLALAAGFYGVPCNTAVAAESALWQQFKRAKFNATETIKDRGSRVAWCVTSYTRR